jgi:hypothetical protein
VCWYNFPSFKIQKAGEVLCVGIAHKTSPAFSTQNFTGLLYFERRKIIPIIYKQFQNKLRSLIEKNIIPHKVSEGVGHLWLLNLM